MNINRKHSFILIIMVIVLFLSFGYAYLNTSLNINGATNVNSSTWNVYWDNVVISNGSVTGSQVTQTPIIDTNKTAVSFQVRLSKPGDYYEFTVDAKNAGSIDAMIDTITKTVNVPNYLRYTVTYGDDLELAQYQSLRAGTTETYKVRVEFRTDINASDLPSTAQSITLSFGATYVQATSAANDVVRSVSFASDSWSVISTVARQNNPCDYYSVGDTKTVTVSGYGDYTVRVSNCSKPAVCSTSGFSQSSCGLVLEFVDIIGKQRMNPYVSGNTNSGNGNYGGWPASELRNFLNTTIYSALPNDLKSVIVNTSVFSGQNFDNNTSTCIGYTSSDKLYLLNYTEIVNYAQTSNDCTLDKTRQLDYYSGLGLTPSSYTNARKKYTGSYTYYWTRTTSTSSVSQFYSVSTTGSYSSRSVTSEYGYSPAFKVG